MVYYTSSADIFARNRGGGRISAIKKVNDLLYFHCFMAGGIIALLERQIHEHKTRKQDITEYIVLSLICVFCILQQFISHELPSGIFMIIAIILLIISIILFNRSLSIPSWLAKIMEPLVWFATISYPFYLLHQNIGFIIIRWLESAGLTSEFSLIIPFAVITSLAFWLHKYVEKPMNLFPRN